MPLLLKLLREGALALSLMADGDALYFEGFAVGMPAEQVRLMLGYERDGDVGTDLYDVRLGGLNWTCWLALEDGRLERLILTEDGIDAASYFRAAEAALAIQRDCVPFRLNLNGKTEDLPLPGASDALREKRYREFLAALLLPGNRGGAAYMQRRDLGRATGTGPDALAALGPVPVYRLTKEDDTQTMLVLVTLPVLLEQEPDALRGKYHTER